MNSRYPFACLIVLAIAQLGARYPSAAVAIQTARENRAADVQQWIVDLGSDEFSVRSRAAQNLWRNGPDSIPPLERSAATSDPERAARIGHLLILLRSGLKPDSPTPIIDSVTRFATASYFERAAIANDLVARDYDDLLLQLVTMLPRGEQILTLQEEPWTWDLIHKAIRDRRHDRLANFFALNSVQSIWPVRSVMFQLENGDIEGTIERLKIAVQLGESADSIETSRQLLLRLLAASGLDDQVAQQLAQAPPSPELGEFRRRWRLKRIPFAELSDQWSAAGDRVDADVPWLAKYLIHRWSGHPERADALLEQMLSSGALQPRQCMIAAVLALDSALLQRQIQPEFLADYFELTCSLGHPDEAFELISMPSPADERLAWFDTQVRRLVSLYNKADRTGDDAVVESYERQLTLLLSVTEELATLGLREEAEYFLSKMAMVFPVNDFRAEFARKAVLQRLVAIDARATARRLVTRCSDDEARERVADLYPDLSDPNLAVYWNDQLAETIPDWQSRLERLDQILRRDDTSTGAPSTSSLAESLLPYAYMGDAPATRLLQVARTFAWRQDDAVAVDLYREAASLGSEEATVELADLRMEQQHYSEALRLYRTLDRSRHAICAAICSQELGDPSAASLYFDQAIYEGQYDAGFWDLTDAITFHWQYRYDDDRLGRCWKVLELESGDARWVHQDMSRALQDKAPARSLRAEQELLLELILSGSISQLSLQEIAGLITEVELHRSLAELETQPQRSVESIGRIVRFAPVNASTMRAALPRLRAHGLGTEADRLFQEFESSCWQVLQRYPESGTYLNNYAWILALENRNLTNAAALVQAAIRTSPDNPNYLDTLAEVEYRMGNRQRAAELNLRCLRLNPASQYYQQQRDRFAAAPPERPPDQ